MGTTVATNALLERKGEPHAAGCHRRAFADALRIGVPGTGLDCSIDRSCCPSCCTREVVEVERAHGRRWASIVAPLDEDAARRDLQAALRRRGHRGGGDRAACTATVSSGA
jgi:5-oxoprolinase (ATP-hydrolysing)